MVSVFRFYLRRIRYWLRAYPGGVPQLRAYLGEGFHPLRGMAEGHLSPATELWASPHFDGMPMQLVPAPGTASGYKRVKKIDEGTFAAYRTVAGKQQHVWTSDDPRDCAYVLARLELEPCSEEAIKEACKAFAKERAQLRAVKRKRDELSRRIDAMHKRYVVAPRIAREARERSRMDQGAAVERVPLSPVKNGAL